jgi:DNA-binding response OmpR family regulator
MLKKRLLLIEDDFDVAEMLQVYFSAQGYQIFNAYSGKDGIAVARAKSPNLILLDVMLPDMDGFDVCKGLRTTPLTKYIPIIFLTQRDRRADKVAGLELGADDYITKPFDIEELRLRVQGSLRRASREALTDERTGLPTGAAIAEAERTFAARDGWYRLQITLNGFGAFRDYYSFVAADEVLNFFSYTLSECLAQHGTPEDFAAMHSETHYSVFTFAPQISALISALQERLQAGFPTFYNFADRERGYLIVEDEQSEAQHVPLLSAEISISEYRAPTASDEPQAASA